jgi:hypothetical protein
MSPHRSFYGPYPAKYLDGQVYIVPCDIYELLIVVYELVRYKTDIECCEDNYQQNRVYDISVIL